jgi:hypothetical protein
MSNDEQGKDVKAVIAGEAKALVVEAYKDAAKPAVTQVGKTVGLAVEVALAPLDLVLNTAKAAFGRLSAALTRKLSNVPADRLLPPPATIAAPAAVQYALLGEGAETSVLREMFEDLLVKSMDRDTTATAHPAFTSMISQLSQDEAWILKSIDRTWYEYIDLGQTHGLRTLLGVGIGINEGMLSSYIANLVRLGIFQWHSGLAGSYKDAPAELQRRVEAEFPGTDVHGLYVLYLTLTPLGKQFLEVCVNINVPQAP